MNPLPNLLTGARLVLALCTFFGLAAAALLSDRLPPAAQFALERWAFCAFVVAAVTDFFDGWLARRLNAVTIWGAILDPIADKVLVCGVILGLLTLGPNAAVAIPAALILFREFTVSALREVASGKGVVLPVTLLAKWKTTLQLTALGAELLVACWAAFGLPDDPTVLGTATTCAHGMLWFAALITLITGAQYWAQARHALGDRRPADADSS
jgi:CDP-diacylglycerol--glycerol-3-phosphate 3-phosphatidyltransferase